MTFVITAASVHRDKIMKLITRAEMIFIFQAVYPKFAGHACLKKIKAQSQPLKPHHVRYSHVTRTLTFSDESNFLIMLIRENSINQCWGWGKTGMGTGTKRGKTGSGTGDGNSESGY